MKIVSAPITLPDGPAREVAIVQVGKALDFRTAATFRTLCQARVGAGTLDFILDFSETDILDSLGLGAIFSLYRQVTPKDGQVVFASVQGSVQTVVELTHMDTLCAQYPSVEAARDALY